MRAQEPIILDKTESGEETSCCSQTYDGDITIKHILHALLYFSLAICNKILFDLVSLQFMQRCFYLEDTDHEGGWCVWSIVVGQFGSKYQGPIFVPVQPCECLYS